MAQSEAKQESRVDSRQTSGMVTTGGLFADRSTRLGIIGLIIGVIVIGGLIAAITLFSAQTISRTIASQAREQQKLTVGSLASQVESLFSNIANELLGLSTRPELQSTNPESRTDAVAAMTEVGSRRSGIIRGIVRLDRDGAPVYAYPALYQDRLNSGQSLSWSVDRTWIDNVIRTGRVQLSRASGGGEVVYLLVIPIIAGADTNVLAMEIDVPETLRESFRNFQPSGSTQLWVLDEYSSLAYQLKPEPVLSVSPAQILSINDTQLVESFPSPERESYISPVNTAYSGTGARTGTFTLILSRESAEGGQEAVNTLTGLFLIGVLVITLLLGFALFIVRSQLREAQRFRHAENRRTTARTLLEVSRALNSSLDVNVVLQRILDELSAILPYDSASVFLLDEEKKNIIVAAETGAYTPDMERKTIPLTQVRGAREVLLTDKPVVINDASNDPRFTVVPGSKIKAWLGVPLRIRNEPVGVLNIDSHAPNRYREDDIELAEAFADQAGAAINSARAHELQISSYETELETAQAIQNSLLPQEAPAIPRLDVAARALPARHVSGDYHQYFPLPDGKFALAVGDVSGKGIPAALLMAVITTALRDEILRFQSPAKLLNELNTRLLPRMQSTRMNSALTVTVFDPLARRAEVASGGMVQPYMRTSKGWEFVEIGGYPLGASSRSSYSSVTLSPVTTMVFITDGVVESMNADGELYGFDRFEELLNAMPPDVSADQIADRIIESVHEYLNGVEAPDDITVVVVNAVPETVTDSTTAGVLTR